MSQRKSRGILGVVKGMVPMTGKEADGKEGEEGGTHDASGRVL